MISFPPSLERLVQLFGTLPGIGRKSATRIVLRLVDSSEAECRELARAIVDAKERTRKCSVCGGLTEDDPCCICSDARRDDRDWCASSNVRATYLRSNARDATTAATTCLDGLLSPLDGVGPDDLRIDDLVTRARDGSLREVILALNPTAEGEATSLYIGKLLGPPASACRDSPAACPSAATSTSPTN